MATRRPTFPTSITRRGYDNRTPTGGGTIQLVTPMLMHWTGGEHQGLIGILRLQFVPEPSSWLILISGIGLLSVLSWRRRARSAGAFLLALGQLTVSYGRELPPPREKEKEMRNIVRIIGASLASMAGIVLVSGVAWAQATETPIEVQVVDCRLQGDPDREWVDDDGIRHIRDQMFRCKRRRDMVGTDTRWASGDFDGAGGYQFERGYYAFTGRILGGELTSGVGATQKNATGPMVCGSAPPNDVLHLDGGGMVKISVTWEGDDPTRSIYPGTFLETPGGAKRNGPRSK